MSLPKRELGQGGEDGGGENVPLHKRLVPVLADPLDEAGTRELLAQPVRREAVLGEAKVEQGGYVDAADAQLLLLLYEVGAADEADGDLVAELREELEHLWGGFLRGIVSGELSIWLFGERGGVCGVLELQALKRRGGVVRGERTPRAGVNVLSTSKSTTVFLMGRSLSGG